MKITKKGEYALRVMLYLAKYEGEVLVKLNEISEKEDISLAYLHQLVRNLKKDKLIKSVRGPNGGYALNKSSSKISVLQILASTEEVLKSYEASTTNRESTRILNNFFLEVDKKIFEKLDIKLSDLVDTDA